jgi:hypothetical protein
MMDNSARIGLRNGCSFFLIEKEALHARALIRTPHGQADRPLQITQISTV